MTNKCQWVESHLEAYFSEDLNSQERQVLEGHVEGCAACRSELDEFAHVDALVSAHFAHQLSRAQAPIRTTLQPFRLAAATATMAVVGIAVWFSVGGSPAEQGSSEPVQQLSVSAESAADTIEKAEDTPNAELAKPDPVVDATPEVEFSPTITGPEASESRFYVQDSAGYFHTLSDYSGSILVLGVVDENTRARAAFDQAYERYSSEMNVRFLGVPTEGTDLESARFPTMTNRESSLLDTGPGEFAIVGPDGTIHARGSLDEAELLTTIERSLEQLRPPAAPR